MRQLSPAVVTLLSQKRVEMFFLVSIANDYRFTTLPYDITMSDGLLYLSDGGLLNVEPPRLTTSIDREAYRVSLADTAFNFRPILEAGIVGKPLVVRVGVLNSSGASLLDYGGTSIAPDQPLTNLGDTFLSYKGIIDSHQYSIDFEEGENTLTIEGSSPMADLDLIKTYFTNKESLKQRNPADTAFDNIYSGSGEIKFEWGKV